MSVWYPGSSLFFYSFIHFWHAPLRVRNAKRRHQSPEWAILSQVDCFVQGEVKWFQVGMLDEFISGVLAALRFSLFVCNTLVQIWLFGALVNFLLIMHCVVLQLTCMFQLRVLNIKTLGKRYLYSRLSQFLGDDFHYFRCMCNDLLFRYYSELWASALQSIRRRLYVLLACVHASVHALVHKSVSPSVRPRLFPWYLQYRLIVSLQTFVVGASWDIDEPIRFCGQSSKVTLSWWIRPAVNVAIEFTFLVYWLDYLRAVVGWHQELQVCLWE